MNSIFLSIMVGIRFCVGLGWFGINVENVGKIYSFRVVLYMFF